MQFIKVFSLKNILVNYINQITFYIYSKKSTKVNNTLFKQISFNFNNCVTNYNSETLCLKVYGKFKNKIKK